MWRLILPTIACLTLGIWPMPINPKALPYWVEYAKWVVENQYELGMMEMLYMAVYFFPWLWLVYAVGDYLNDSESGEK